MLVYAIWFVSLIVGLVLATSGNSIGWLILIGGFLVGYAIGKRRDEDRLARKIASAQKDDEAE